MYRSCYERGFESRNVRPRSAVPCGVRDHGKADCNQRNSGGARRLPNGPFRYAGMRLACLRSSVRCRQAARVSLGPPSFRAETQQRLEVAVISGLAAAIARRVVASDLPMPWPCRAVLPVESRIRASDRLERLFATRFVPWRPIGIAALFDVCPFDADVVDHKSFGPASFHIQPHGRAGWGDGEIVQPHQFPRGFDARFMIVTVSGMR
jgi:hypothetical protein